MKKIFSLLVLIIFLFSGSLCYCQDSIKTSETYVIDSLTAQIKRLSIKETQAEINKKMIADFYQELFGDKNLNAIDKYIGDVYIQHNPSVSDGKQALKEALKVWFTNTSKEKINIQHIIAEDNLVMIHTKSQKGSKVFTIIDIFRIENGKIVEHWDVMQEVPQKSANKHPMF